MTSISRATTRYLERLRPRCFADLVGQPKLTAALQRLVRRVRSGDQPFPPLLLVGRRDVGTEALASAMAHELTAGDREAIRRVDVDGGLERQELVDHLELINPRDVMIVEGVDTLDRSVRTRLLRAATEFKVRIAPSDSPDSDNTARRRLPLPEFSLVATAVREPDVGVGSDWNPVAVREYNTEELIGIIDWCVDRLDIDITDGAAFKLARHSRGRARRLKVMLIRVLLESVEALSQKDQWLIEEWMVDEIYPPDEV